MNDGRGCTIDNRTKCSYTWTNTMLQTINNKEYSYEASQIWYLINVIYK